MKILIDNRDLPYSIDTYGMFNGENVEDGEAEHYLGEFGLPIEDYEMDYDHKGIVQEFAEYSINFIEQALAHEKPKIVRSIELKDTYSPQFYNYTTDGYRAEWDIDEQELNSYITSQLTKYGEWLKESNWIEKAKEWDEETQLVIKLDYYLTQVYELDDYNLAMWEAETEVYVNNSKPSKEMEAKLKQLQEATE